MLRGGLRFKNVLRKMYQNQTNVYLYLLCNRFPQYKNSDLHCGVKLTHPDGRTKVFSEADLIVRVRGTFVTLAGYQDS